MQNISKNKLTPNEFNKMNSEEKILKMASGLTPPEGKQKSDVLDSLLTKIEESTPNRKISFKRYLQAAAAVLIILTSLKVVPNFISAQIKTNYAQQSEVILPDGTNVTLNADSKLEWNKKHFTEERYLTLSGEAYFDVKKGDEFIIKTKNGTVEILGTQLNIYSRGNDFWVSCISGKVKVSTDNQQQTITPGEWVQLNNLGLEKSMSAAIEKTAAWKDGVCHFEETKLETIFAELERQFNVSIQFKGDDKRIATIDFPNSNLNEALDIVCIPMELDYDVKNKKITISEKK